MNIKKSELMDSINESRKFIEELIYENIGLSDKYIRLEFENRKLRERIEKLEKDKRESRKKSLKNEDRGYIIFFSKKGFSPSVRELASMVGLKTTYTIHTHL